VQRAGVPLYADNDHISRAGTELLVPMFEQVVAR